MLKRCAWSVFTCLLFARWKHTYYGLRRQMWMWASFMRECKWVNENIWAMCARVCDDNVRCSVEMLKFNINQQLSPKQQNSLHLNLNKFRSNFNDGFQIDSARCKLPNKSNYHSVHCTLNIERYFLWWFVCAFLHG